MINFLCFCILILPWIVINDPLRWGIDTVWFPKYIFLDLVFLSSLAFMFLREPEVRYKNRALGWFLLWAFASFSFFWFRTLVIPKVIGGSYTVNFALWNLIPSTHLILATVFALFLIIYLLESEWQRILNALAFSAVFVCIFALFQSIGFDPFKSIRHQYFSDNHFIALMGNANVAGAFCALTAPLFLGRKEIIFKVLFAILVLGVFRSLSALNCSALIISVFVWLALSRKRKLFLVASSSLLIFLAFFFFFKPNFFNLTFRLEGRIGTWLYVVEQVKLNPFFGYGLGSWSQLEYGKKIGSMWLWAHNDYLQMIYELGLIGFGLFVWVLSELLLKIKTRIRAKTEFSPLEINCICSVIGFLVLCFGMYPFQIAPLALAGLLPFAYLERR